MAWTCRREGGNDLGMVKDYHGTYILSNAALAAGTVDLVQQINTLLGANTVPGTGNTGAALPAGSTQYQWAVVSFISDSATAGSATFNNADADQKRRIPVVVGETTRKSENSPYWFARPNAGISLTTDVALADIQIVLALL